LKHNLTCNCVDNICVACLFFQILKLIAQFYESANIFETQDAMEWPTKKFGNTASVETALIRHMSMSRVAFYMRI
jgi:hypothetical protein